MARRLVIGEKPSAIAEAMGITKSRFSIICASPAFQAHVARLKVDADKAAADIRGRISSLCIDSMTVLEAAIRLKQEGISAAKKVDLAKDVLAMGGFGPVQKTLNADLTLTAQDIEDLRIKRDAQRTAQARVINTPGAEVAE